MDGILHEIGANRILPAYDFAVDLITPIVPKAPAILIFNQRIYLFKHGRKRMRLTTRLTRAGAALVIFGTVASIIPNIGMTSAGACDGGSHNHTGDVVAGTVVIGGLAWAASSGVIVAGDKKKKGQPDPDTQGNNWIYSPNP